MFDTADNKVSENGNDFKSESVASFFFPVVGVVYFGGKMLYELYTDKPLFNKPNMTN